MTDTPLKPCPCGKVPTELNITDAGQGGKWAYACGDCCGEWNVEFRTQYLDLDSEACKRIARDEWNGAPRWESKP